MDRDRNLLFGVLAVQLHKITPSQLITAASAWAADQSQNLGAWLVHQRALDEADRMFIEDVVSRAAQDHANDSTAALASFGGEATVHAVFGGSIVLTDSEGVETVKLPKLSDEPVQYLDAEDVPGVQETPGRYSHVSEYGRGGMGRVLLVHDAFLGRDVALKELLPGPASKDPNNPSTPVRKYMGFLSRFLQEARITGQLEHPSIVPVYELGHRKDGTLYYTMKLVRGKTLRKAIDECKNLQDRLELLSHFVNLCQAIAYAHSRGVIHRDLKPDNIMIGEFGETVVLDWGLAKAKDKVDVHSEGMAETIRMMNLGDVDIATRTQYGQVLGTPAYMPPEQAKGQLDFVDERSDVYSLGAVLYVLLSGKPPFTGRTALEILQHVIEDEPTTLKESEAPAELVSVCTKAMQKRPYARYASAGALAEEIQRFQSGAIVQAYSYKFAEHLKRFVARRKSILATVAAATLLLLGLAVYFNLRLLESRDTEREQRLVAEAATRESDHQRSLAEKQTILAEEQRKEAEKARDAERLQREAAQVETYASLVLLASAYHSRSDYESAREVLLSAPEEARNWEWGYLYALPRRTLLTTLPLNTNSALAIGVSKDTSRVAALSRNGRVRVLDTKSGNQLRAFTISIPPSSSGPDGGNVIFSSDGSLLLTVLSFYRHFSLVDVWDLNDGSHISRIIDKPEDGKHRDTYVFSTELSPADDTVFIKFQNELQLFDARTGKQLRSMRYGDPVELDNRFEHVEGEYIELACVSPDGGQFALTYSADFAAKIYDTASGQMVLAVDDGRTEVVPTAFSADGKYIAALCGEDGVWVWDIPSKNVVARFPEARYAARFSSDNKTLITGCTDNTVKIWEIGSASLMTTLSGHSNEILSVQFGPNDYLAASVSKDGTARVWNVETGQCLQTVIGSRDEIQHMFIPPVIHFGSKEDTFITYGIPLPIQKWKIASDAPATGLEVDSSYFYSTLNVDGTRGVMTQGYSRLRKRVDIHIWDGTTGTPVKDLEPSMGTSVLAGFCPSGTWLATGTRDGNVQIWNASTGSEAAKLKVHDKLNQIAVSEDANIIFTGHSSRTESLGLIWDVASGRQTAKLDTQNDYWSEVNVAFSRNGENLVAAGKNVDIFDIRTGGHVLSFPSRLVSRTMCVAFSPDGSRIVAGSADGTVQVWLAQSGRELLTLVAAKKYVKSVGFDPSGRILYVSSMDAPDMVAKTTHYVVEEFRALPWSRSAWDTPAKREQLVQNALLERPTIKEMEFSSNARNDALALFTSLMRHIAESATPDAGAALVEVPGLGIQVRDPAKLEMNSEWELETGDLIVRIGNTAITSTEVAVEAVQEVLDRCQNINVNCQTDLEILNGFKRQILSINVDADRSITPNEKIGVRIEGANKQALPMVFAKGEVSIGRAADNDICLRDDPQVADYQALIVYDNGGWHLKQLAQESPIYYISSPLSERIAVSFFQPLMDRDRIKIGSTRLRVDIPAYELETSQSSETVTTTRTTTLSNLLAVALITGQIEWLQEVRDTFAKDGNAVSSMTGIVITEDGASSDWTEFGLRYEDTISQFNDVKLDSFDAAIDAFEKCLTGCQNGDVRRIDVKVLRNGKPYTFIFDIKN